MERLSMFVISIIVASMAVLGIGVFYSGLSQGYGTNDTSNITNYNQMTQINNITNNLNNKITEQPTSTGGFAVLGDFLSYGYNTLQLTLGSYNLFYAMLEYGFKSIPTDSGSSGAINLFMVGLGSIVIVLIVFIIIGYWGGRQGL